jgi:uncharacterized protein YgbK (DUF1537 family)
LHITIIADDLTGAADSAAAFACAGLSTLVSTTAALPEDADVISLNTDSRDLPATLAAKRVEQALQQPNGGRLAPLIYKKMDSALRGQFEAELIATMRALGLNRAVVAPALPVERRTTIAGRQHFNGMPLEQTTFSKGLATSDLVEAFRQAVPNVAVSLVTVQDLEERGAEAFTSEGIAVADAESDRDLERIARSALEADIKLLSGSAGLARALARTSGLESHIAPPPPRAHNSGPVLLIVGSQHNTARRQVEVAAQSEIVVIRPRQVDIDEPDGSIQSLMATCEEQLISGNHVMLTTAAMERSPLGSSAVALRLASILDSPVIRQSIGGIVMTGGDVAAACCARLGSEAIWLCGELKPAIPIGHLAGGALPGLPVITKAGSFGAPETLVDCVATLSTDQR